MKNKILRQGDVLLVPRATPKQIKKEEGPAILAYGETTGHAHVAVNSTIFVDLNEEGKRYLKAEKNALLRHGDLNALLRDDIPYSPDHGPIPIAEGWYDVVTQWEYQRKELVRVAD